MNEIACEDERTMNCATCYEWPPRRSTHLASPSPCQQSLPRHPTIRYIRGTIQNVHLHRIDRIAAGESTPVTVAPDDTLCVNNVQDNPGLGRDSERLANPTTIKVTAGTMVVVNVEMPARSAAPESFVVNTISAR